MSLFYQRRVLTRYPSKGARTRDGLGVHWRDAIRYVTDDSGPPARPTRAIPVCQETAK